MSGSLRHPAMPPGVVTAICVAKDRMFFNSRPAVVGCVPLCHGHPVASDVTNPDQHQASEVRRRALVDQIVGLEMRISDGRNELHVTKRLADTCIELEGLQGGH
jgi:hypothetical protein